MFERFHRKSTPAILAAVLAALGVGGVAVAQGGGSSTPPAKAPAGQSTAETPGQESNAPENSATDSDNVQQGDQSAADDRAEGPESANEKAEGPESAAEESGSEVPNDDGPGGHADEPANPNADTQQQGQN
jgi:hypothetical protein